LGAFTGFLIVFAIQFDNSCAKLTNFTYHIFYLLSQTLLFSEIALGIRKYFLTV
jgi:hypothetical protein